MKWTIGMPCYKNYTEVWFTVQSLRMHHDLTDCEIVIVDNYGDNSLFNFVRKDGGSVVKYERFTDITGVSAAKNRIFDVAKGEYVLVMDSHILIKSGGLDVVPPGDDMIQGPLVRGNIQQYYCDWKKIWRAGMWGIWGNLYTELPSEMFEIWAMGAGFFAVRRDSWLGFNPGFRGFGGETGYIQEKYRKAGRRVLCDPSKIWLHFFNDGTDGRQIPYENKLNDRIRNYVIGFNELGLDVDEVRQVFGTELFDKAMNA